MRDHLDDAVATAIEEELARRVRPARRARPARRNLPALVATAVVAAAVLAVAVAAIRVGDGAPPAGGCASSGCAAASTPSVTVRGRALRYAGHVPWSGAITGLEGPDSVTVRADGDALKGSFFVCGLPEERAHVVETASTVTIDVAGYAEPLPDGVLCGGVGHPAQPITVHLAAPLGERRLIDPSDDVAHRTLPFTAVPIPAAIPSGYVADAPAVTWNEQGHTVTRRWARSPSTDTSGAALALTVLVQPGASIEDTSGREVAGFDLGGRTVRVWRYSNELNWDADLRWTLADGRAAQLWYRADPSIHLSLADLEAVVRSIP